MTEKALTKGILHAVSPRSSTSKPASTPGDIDITIVLKCGMLRSHIHRYTLRIKNISLKPEEEVQNLVLVLQGDPKSIIPSFFELDRSDHSVPDLPSA